MKFKRIAAAVIAAAAAFAPITSDSISPFIPSAECAEEYAKGAALPDWIPYDYDTALNFRNTYGATLIKDGLVCIVFREQYEKVPEDEPQGVLRYEVRTTKDMMKELKHTVYGSEDSGYCYEVVVYFAPQEEGKFEVALVDTWIKSTDLDLGYNHAVAYYSFLIGKDKSITETDIYSWLPDSITEYDEYVSKNGKVSSKDEFVVFCLDSSAGTKYKWYEPNENYKDILTLDKITDCSIEKGKELDGGTVKNIYVYKAVKSGSAKIQWNYVPSHDYGEIEAEKALIADCTVPDDMHVIVDNAYIQGVPFKAAQYSLYSGDLTVSSYEIYDKFSKPQTAVITSKKELAGFLSEYLNEKALNTFVSQYSEDFFDDNVLMLNTYLDPYRGRVFKYGLEGVYCKDNRLTVDFTSVVSANLMRTSYFSVLQLEVPKEYYNDECDVVWNCREVLNYDLKRISVIDEDTGEHIAIPRENVLDMFGNKMKYLEGGNPYYWDVITAEWLDLDIDSKLLPEEYVLSEDKPKEIINYGNNTADIIFRVKKTKPIEIKYKIDKFSTITQGLFSDKMTGSVFQGFEPAIAESTEELSDILSLYITEDYQKKYYSAYDEDFFKDKVLLLNFFADATGGDKIKINDSNIIADNITVYYSKPAPDFNVCNTDYFFILQVAVPKSSYNRQKTTWKCMGDTNGDGEFGIADLVTLQKWLLAKYDTVLSDRKTADLCKDNVIDAFDLVAMRKMLISIHKLDTVVKYAINTQSFRSNNTYLVNDPQTTMINSTDELQSYLNSGNYGDALDKYDDIWFGSYKLMLISLEETSGSIRHEVTDLTSNYATINRLVPEIMTCDMAAWDILIELDKNAVISDNFKINLTKTLIH